MAPLPPSMCATQDSAADIGNWMTAFAVTSSSVHSTMAVVEASDDAYSSYDIIETCSQVAWDSTRTFAVSWVPHCRAKVSNASSSTLACSRARVVGRRKS